MSLFYSQAGVELHHGDCLEVMRQMEECSVDAVVCDPPYGLKFMGKRWDDPGSFVERRPNRETKFDRIGGNHNPCNPQDAARTAGVENRRQQAWHEAWAREAIRVLRPGGFLLAFGGTRTYHRLACAIEDAGFEIRDTIQWIYGSGFPKSKSMRDIGKPELGTALKPSHEPIVMARKPLSESSIARQVLSTDTGALNIAATRVAGPAGNGHWTHKREIGDGNIYGGGGRTEEDFCNNNPSAGRWPANLLLSHHESCQMIGTKRVRGIGGGDQTKGPYTSDTTWSTSSTPPSKREGYADPDGMEEVEGWECVEGCPVQQLGEPARFFKQFHEPDTGPGFFYSAKASRRERNAGLEWMPERERKADSGIDRGYRRCADCLKAIGGPNDHSQCSSDAAEIPNVAQTRQRSQVAPPSPRLTTIPRSRVCPSCAG